MEQRRRRQQQRSRERKEAAESQPDRAPQMEIGAADRRLDALIEEELKTKAARAQSVPVRAAEVKRLGVAASAGSGHGGPPMVAASSGERLLKEAEETFAREVKKMTDGGDSASFTWAPSAQAKRRREANEEPAKPGGLPDTPPGLARVHDPRGRGDGLNGSANMMKPLDSVTAALPEAMRNLELPPLPAPSAENAALLFGDWLTVITPLMGGLSTSSKEFWDWVQREVDVKYNEWLLATPLARLRIKVEEQVSPRFQRLDQRASSTLLAALPEPVRRDIVASRRVATQAILYKLFTIYQPGGNACSLTEVKCGSSIQDTLSAVRKWRRWLCRAEELRTRWS